MTLLPYAILEAKPLGPYNVLGINGYEDMPENGHLQSLLDHAISFVSNKLNASQQVAKSPAPTAFVVLHIVFSSYTSSFFITVTRSFPQPRPS